MPRETLSPLEKYEQSLQSMSQGDWNHLIFPCEGLENNLAVVCHFLTRLKSLQIYLPGLVGLYLSEKFIHSLEKYLFQGGKVEIIIFEVDSYLKTYNRLRQYVEDRQLFKYDSFTLRGIESNVNYDDISTYPGFIIGDVQYRIEVGNSHLKSLVCYNCLETVEKYADLFTYLRGQSRNLYIENDYSK